MEDRKLESKICAVCGDLALGYNFNAVTCESCKAFFRRNAYKENSLRCPFKQSCQITSVTRRFCQKCRLEECFRVGMKKELIMSDEEKSRKRRKIEANKAKARCGSAPQSLPNEKGVQTEVQTKSVQVSETFDKCVQTDLDPIASAYERPMLSSTQLTMINDLIIASQALEAPLDKEVPSLPGVEFRTFGSGSLLDVINLTAVAIRRLIKMCKRLSGFKALPQPDQLSLLKHGCTQMMLLKSIVSLDPDRNAWKIPHSVDQMSRIKLEVLKEARGNLYEAHNAFVKSFDTRASSDTNIINILIAITLFDPDRPNLIERDLIRGQQESYYELLHRYLDTKYSEFDSRYVYRHLINKMAELYRLNEDYVRVYLDVNPSQVEPLLIEIFDLKPH